MSRPYTATAVQSQNRFLYQMYAWMGVGVLLTAFAAFFTAQNTVLTNMLFGGRGFNLGQLVLFGAELALVWYLSSRIMTLSFETGVALFSLYSVLNGVSLSVIFHIYTDTSIVSTFFTCAALFFAMSFYGWTTKADLSKWGNILFMALIGVVIAGLVNFFLHSSVFGFIISFIGVLVFTGLTAYDTWKFKEAREQLGDDAVMVRKLGLLGALSLYLDFINLFLMLLRLLGGRRN